MTPFWLTPGPLSQSSTATILTAVSLLAYDRCRYPCGSSQRQNCRAVPRHVSIVAPSLNASSGHGKKSQTWKDIDRGRAALGCRSSTCRLHFRDAQGRALADSLTN